MMLGLKPKCSPLQRMSRAASSVDDAFGVDEVVFELTVGRE